MVTLIDVSNIEAVADCIKSSGVQLRDLPLSFSDVELSVIDDQIAFIDAGNSCIDPARSSSNDQISITGQGRVVSADCIVPTGEARHRTGDAF